MSIEEEFIFDLENFSPKDTDNIGVEIAMRTVPGTSPAYHIRILRMSDKEIQSVLLLSYTQVEQLTTALLQYCNSNDGLKFLFGGRK